MIIDYGSGNLHSVAKSFQAVANRSTRGVIEVSREPIVVGKADRIVLPGVGAFADCKNGLIQNPRLLKAIKHQVLVKKVPFLGICVGHQMLASYGFEHEVTTRGLNWIEGRVVPILSPKIDLKIPHMGWNSLFFDRSHYLFQGIKEGSDVYFVHSYHLVPNNMKNRLAYTNYGQRITASVIKNNMIGTQFHPEKSQEIGLKFIENFLTWTP